MLFFILKKSTWETSKKLANAVFSLQNLYWSKVIFIYYNSLSILLKDAVKISFPGMKESNMIERVMVQLKNAPGWKDGRKCR